MKQLLLLAGAFLILAPAAEASVAASSSFAGGEVPHDKPIQVPVTVELGCDLVLLGGGTATVAILDLPGWLTADTATVSAAPTDCVPGVDAGVVREAVLTLTPAANAPGLATANLNATVTYQGEVAEEPEEAVAPIVPLFLAYKPGHTIDPDGDQTFQVQGSTPYSFTLKIAVQANARTMVMFEDKVVSDPRALLNGLKAETYDVPNGKVSEDRKVVFTPPKDAWDRVTVSFRTYSHCLDGEECGNQLERTVTWTFMNAAPAAATTTTSDAKGASAPAFALVLLAVGLVAMRRR